MLTLTHVGEDYIEVEDEKGRTIQFLLEVAEIFLDGKIAIDPLIDKKELRKLLDNN